MGNHDIWRGAKLLAVSTTPAPTLMIGPVKRGLSALETAFSLSQSLLREPRLFQLKLRHLVSHQGVNILRFLLAHLDARLLVYQHGDVYHST